MTLVLFYAKLSLIKKEKQTRRNQNWKARERKACKIQYVDRTYTEFNAVDLNSGDTWFECRRACLLSGLKIFMVYLSTSR
jgi:hypothetical protein